MPARDNAAPSAASLDNGTPSERTVAWRSRLTKGLLGAALFALVLIGGVLRLSHLNWDRLQHVHPDERFIVWVADTMSWPSDLATALDPMRSPINPFRWPPGSGDLAGKPRAYAYGHFPLYLSLAAAHLARAVAEWMGQTTIVLPAFLQPVQVIGRHLTEYNYLPLVGRATSALCDVGTILLVFFLGTRLYGRAAGLLASACYALAVLPIQLSHFYAVDMVLTFTVALTVALAIRRTEGGGWVTWILVGAAAGLAVGSKFSAVLLIGPLAAAAILSAPDGSWRRKGLATAGQLVAAGAVASVVFTLTNPFALLDAGAYLRNILAQNAMVSGLMDAPYTRQYIGTLPYWYDVQQVSQWGLGLPLGVMAWAGSCWAVSRAARRRAGSKEVVMLAWAVPYFLVTGAFHAKFLRYMAPLLPFLLVFGGGAAMAACRWLSGWRGRVGRLVWSAGITAILLCTAVWTMAFTAIYRQEHPWIQASRWIYRNIPANSEILTEHWDDALPLTMDEISDRPPLREYHRVELPLYEPDSSEKLETLVSELSRADYVVIATNRLSAPIQRLPRRYPMASQYYHMLFSGELGYRKAAEFTAYPRLGSLIIPDDHADESFTVYDHPRVQIFVNEERLSAALLRARLGRYLPLGTKTTGLLLSTNDRRSVRPAVVVERVAGLARYRDDAQPPAPNPPLMLPQPVDALPVVADFRWNRPASEWVPLSVLLWWLIVSAFGWFAWPLVYPLFGGLRDRGYGLSRAVGWLLLGWVNWIAVSRGLWQNRATSIAAVLAGLAVTGAGAAWLQRGKLRAFWHDRSSLILAEEAVFALAYLGLVGLRILNPDLWQPWNGGEKFMESAFLNAVLRSAHFPPYDPYFAGGALNYYYYGLYLISLPIKLTGIVPEVSFNLGVASLYGLSAVGFLSVVASLVAGVIPPTADDQHGDQGNYGLASAPRLRMITVPSVLALGMALLMSNLAGGVQFLDNMARLGGWVRDQSIPLFGYLAGLIGGVGRVVLGTPLPGYDYWAASRVIPNTINEFPFWTFLFADLHPHLIAVPFGLVLVGLALNWILSSEVRPDASTRAAANARGRRGSSRVFASTVLMAICLGASAVINTWDLPTYLLLVAGAFLLAGWRRARVRSLAGAAGLTLIVLVGAMGAYWPFFASYRAQVGTGEGSGLGRLLAWTKGASPYGPWIQVWGFFLFLALTLVVLEARRRRAVDLSFASREPSTPEAMVGQSAAVEFASGPSDPQSNSEPLDEGSVPNAEDPQRGISVPRWRPWRIGILCLIGLVAVLLVLERPTAAVAVVPLGMACALTLRRWVRPELAFTTLLLALGLGIVAGVELVYVRDFLDGGDWYRMNTVFKFSVPAWLFLSLSCWGALVSTGKARSPHVRGPAAVVRSRPGIWWGGAFVLLLCLGLVFLPLGAAARVKDRFPGPRPAIGTLDATAYMTVGRYTWPDGQHVIDLAYDYQAIHWLLDHVNGTPVLAEAPAGTYLINGETVGYDYYRAGGQRVASITGFPTFVGHHEYEQRPADQVSARMTLGQEFYRTTNPARKKELIRELGVNYIYVGELERILFPEESLRTFDVLLAQGDLEVVFQNPAVRIYRVLGD